MKIRYRTNVDIAKPFMQRVTAEQQGSQPMVGDTVVVLKEPNKVVEMKIVGRTWDTEKSFGREDLPRRCPSVLVIELHLTDLWSQAGLSKFEAHVRG
jgi:hypothetical protein